MEPWKLKRVRQCRKCPWKTSTDPREIPNGYSEQKHRALTSMIAPPGLASFEATDIRAMGCHEHDVAEKAHCIGWLNHQLGPGNNLRLRMEMRWCENAGEIALDGPQHPNLEATFPKEGYSD